MSATWANKLPRWPPHNPAGQVCDLSHLHPLRYALVLDARPGLPARVVDVRVAFSAHTFTRGCLISEDPDYHYSSGPRDLRKFCPDRYELSKRLPDVVRQLDGRKCFFADRDNYLIVELPESLPPGFEYWVFFDVRGVEDPDAVLVFIQSAYVGDGTKLRRGRKGQKVGFRVLVNKALGGTRAKRPH